ncbi:MAG: hypothetical protein V4618_00950 [Pseudomonadota bacterium]
MDRLVARHAIEVSAGRTPSRWRFTPETYVQIKRECADLMADPGCLEVSLTTFLGLPFEVGPIAYDQPFTLD